MAFIAVVRVDIKSRVVIYEHKIMPAVTLTIDDQTITVPQGTTILQTVQQIDKMIPTICYHDHFTPPSLCRVCVVEVEKSRVLVQSCSRACENGMVVRTDTPRVQQSRKTILELLNSAVDTSAAPKIQAYIERLGANVQHYGDGARRDFPLFDDNPFYLRDYSKCIMCWRCVQACGEDVQWTLQFPKRVMVSTRRFRKARAFIVAIVSRRARPAR